MSNIGLTTELFKTAASGLINNPEAMKKGAAALSTTNSKGEISSLLSGFTIPILTDNAEVQKFINEFQLQKPENMIRFFVEAYYSNLECISSAINELKEIDMINSVSLVEAAKANYDHAISNKNKENTYISSLQDAQSKLFDASSQLEDKALFYISKIREIDNRPRGTFFLKSRLSLKAIDENNHCAKSAINALVEAVNLQIMIAAETGDDISSSVIAPYAKFKSKLLSDDSCGLMHAYDDEKDKEFWLSLSDKISNQIETSELLKKYMELNETENDIDYDNIDFS